MSKKGDVHSILDMLVHIADENVRSRRAATARPTACLNQADMEKADWEHMKARLNRRRATLGDDLVADEDDDGDALLVVVELLSASKLPLTTFELVKKLQQRRMLSHEFPAAARNQCIAMLGRLRVANKVWQDAHGRWSLL